MHHPFPPKIPVNAHSEKLLKPIRAAAEKYLGTPVASLPYTQFKSFWETGSRVAYEDCYIEHRRRLDVFAAMALSTDDPKWLAGLEDILWAICDEFTWALPAHIYDREKAGIRKCETTVDLFASETAFALSEVYAILKDRLDPLVRQRIDREVKRRVIDPYMENNLSWPKNNWSAVCAGSIGSAMLLLGLEDTFEQVKERLITSMDLFLESYPDDGYCLEGVLYWGYGFGYFCFFASLLRDYSHGKIDLFKNEKVRQMALFRQKAFLEDNVILPFADAPHNLNCHIGLNHFLAREYEQATVLDERFEAVFDDDTRYRFADFLRDFYWYDETLPKWTKQKEETHCGQSSQWYIKKSDGFAFACKGGNNAEPHNHNDVGCFILYSDKQFIIDDLGWSEYYAGYFGEQRYDFLCTSSRGHSVPILNGQYQQAGSEHAAKILAHDAKGCVLEISGAYEVDSLTALKREFSVAGNDIELTDTVCGDGLQVTERFVTRISPAVLGNAVRIGSYEISCDTQAVVTITSEQFEPRLNICKMDMQPVETAYLIDFQFAPGDGEQKLCFKIKRI